MGADANSRFSEYATSQAFVLTLSRPMIGALVNFARNQGSTELMSAIALERRGLVERRWTHGPKGKRIWKIYVTDAGVLVYQLLRLAGLVERLDYENRRKGAV